MNETIMERLAGSVFGHAYGDAAGARLEFQSTLSERDVEDALQLKGGGVFHVAPGQVTDDTELSIQAFRALQRYRKEGGCVDDGLCEAYADWFNSEPFDIGMTTQNAFGGATSKRKMRFNVKTMNNMSESNGALMRCIPFALYAFEESLSKWDIYHLVCLDVSLTHYKTTVANLVFVYVMMVIYLYKGLDWDTIEAKLKGLCNTLGDSRIKDMLAGYDDYNTVNVAQCMGWDKHAFSLTLYCLKNKLTFVDAMRFVLSRGGDTDTNAAIVGGALGAKYGISSIPNLDKLINCTPNHGRGDFHPRVYHDYFLNTYRDFKTFHTIFSSEHNIP
jgi:ADP-ribosylglycohydrolase